jgi:hypothetical protein
MIVFEIYKMSILFLSIFFIISAAFNEFISEKNKSDKEKNILKNFKEIILKNKKKKNIYIVIFVDTSNMTFFNIMIYNIDNKNNIKTTN